MRNTLTKMLGIPKILGLSSLALTFLFGSGAVMASISLLAKISVYPEHDALSLLLDNMVFAMGLLILILPAVYFFKELIRDLTTSFYLSRTYVTHDGLHIKRKEGILYKWEDIEAINGEHESWRGDYVVFIFNDGKSIEIPIIDSAKDKTINFLKEVYQKAPGRINTNKLAEHLLVE